MLAVCRRTDAPEPKKRRVLYDIGLLVVTEQTEMEQKSEKDNEECGGREGKEYEGKAMMSLKKEKRKPEKGVNTFTAGLYMMLR